MSDAITVRYKAAFGAPRPSGDASPPPTPSIERAPKPPPSRTARMLALAYAIERAIAEGGLRSYSEAAKHLGVSRARVSQIADMVLLPVAVQEAILAGGAAVSERELRANARHGAS